MKTIILFVVCVAICGCAPKYKAPKDTTAAMCPEKTIAMMQQNTQFFETVVPGRTSAEPLRRLKGLKRKASMDKPGEAPMDIVFYQTGLPTCAWNVYTEALTPVVVKNGTIMAVGSDQVKELTAHGWVIKEAAWPWQRYDFGYVPPR